MPTRYFTGTPNALGTVEASPDTSFNDLLARFRICATLPLTREAYFALPEEERNRAKHVRFITPACFKTSPSPRQAVHATVCNLICLDIDPEKVHVGGKWVETGKYPAAPFVRDPDSLHLALGEFAFIAHQTASSTPERPRMRLIVSAEGIPLNRYREAAQTIGALLGLPSVTRESMVPVQPMFLPTMFRGDTDAQHPLITHNEEADDAGRTFTVDDISATEDIPASSSSNGTNGDHVAPTPKPQHTQRTSHPDSDALFFLRAPVPEVSLSVAREALESVDPDVSRAEWLECAQSLCHQFPGPQAEEAYHLFDEWSATGSKYESARETRALWDSIRPTPIGRVPVTIRSLLHKAKGTGWDATAIQNSSFQRVADWMDSATSITELIEKGSQRILAAGLLSTTQEGMLLDQLKRKAKDRFAYSASLTDLKKDFNRLQQEIKSRKRTTEATKEPPWAKGVCFVSSPNEFFRQRTGEKYKGESFDATYGRWLLPTEDQLKEQGLNATVANLAKPVVPPSDYALNHLKIPTVYDYAYDPSRPTEMFFTEGGSKYVNTYSPTYPELDLEHAAEAGAKFVGHINRLVKEPAYRQTLMDYLAYMVQFPGRKICWAILIQGTEGCGKTYLAEAMRAVLGKQHVKTISGDNISSGWNEWAFGYQLVVVEEMRAVGTSRHALMNRLKEPITNSEISVNEKFRNSRTIDNCTNYLMFSNHHDALAITPGNRRYFVLKSPMQNKSSVLALGPDYFPPLYSMLREQPGALRAYLHEWPISSSFDVHGQAPGTVYSAEMVTDSASDLQAAVRRFLLEGDLPLVQYDIVSAKALMDLVQVEEGLRGTSAQQLGHVLREEGYTQIGRHLYGTERHYLWVRNGVDERTAADVAGEREKTGQKNLCMELLF